MTPAHRKKRVDVIILSWDRVDDTLAAIESALAQEGPDIRVQVVDQGSAPEALSRIRRFCSKRPGVIFRGNARNVGVPEGRNQAIALGTAPYVVALDNDAVFADEHQVARAVALMEADSCLGALAFRIVLFENGADDRSSWPFARDIAQWAGRPFDCLRFVGAGHMLRRPAFDAAGGYDERLFFLHEEVDLSYRLLNLGLRIAYTPEVVVRHKISPERRLAWSSGRYYYHVRNTIYLAAKFNFPFASTLLNTGVVIAAGFRRRLGGATVRGIGAGLRLLPAALRHRFRDPRTRLSVAAKKTIRSLSPTAGLPIRKRIAYRLRPMQSRR